MLKPLSKEELEHRHAEFGEAAGLAEINLEQELSELKHRPFIPPPPPSKRVRRWLPPAAGVNNQITWQMDSWGGVAILIENGLLFGETQETPITAFAPIGMKNLHPTRLKFKFTFVPDGDILCFLAEEGVINDEATADFRKNSFAEFTWTISWDRGIPKTPPIGNNFDLVLLNKVGEFIQLQIGLSSKGGRLWISLSEVYAGQVALGTEADAAKLKIAATTVAKKTALALPLYEENAFPGADFMTTTGMAQAIVPLAVKLNRTKPFDQCRIPEWKPVGQFPEELREKGWTPATCHFFNAIIGGGIFLCEDGRPCWINFQAIRGTDGLPLHHGGRFPLIQPMQVVALGKWEGSRTRRAISAKVL